MEAIRWIGEHANRIATAVRAFVYMMVVLNFWLLDSAQQLAIIGFVEAVLSVFVESNVVSKVRVGERIEQEVAKRNGDTGVHKIGVVLLAAAIGLSVACAPGARAAVVKQAVAAEDALTKRILAIDAAGDKLAGCHTGPNLMCQSFNRVMVPVIEAEMAFNRGVKDRNVFALGTLMKRLSELLQTVQTLFADMRDARDALVAEIRTTMAQVSVMETKGGGQ